MNAAEQRNAQLRREAAQLRERIRVLEHSESERRFQKAFEFAAFGMALLNDTGHFIEVNQSLCRMFGYPEQELLAKTFKDVTYPEDLAVGSGLFQDLLSGKRDFGWLEKRYVHKDGHIIWAFLSTSAIRDSQGQLICLVSQIQDITERKQAEDAFQKTNTLLERVFANIHVLIAYLDADFYFIRVNDAYARADGRPPEFFVGKNHFDLYPHAENEAIFRQVVDTGEAYFIHARPFTYPEHPEWGATYWDWSLQPVNDAHGQVIELVLCLVDVTEGVQARESLRKTHRLQEQIFASLNDALFVVDTTTRTIISCNPAVERMFGYKTEEVVGRNTEFLHADRGMYERFGHELFPALDTEGSFRTEFQMRQKDGTIFDTEHTVTEILDDAGHRTGAVSVVRDITARKQAEKALQAYRQRLEELVEVRTTELQTKNEQLQREIEKRKQEKEWNRFQANILSQVKDVVVVIDDQERITFFNQAAEGLYHVKADQALGRPLSECYQYRWLKPEDEQSAYDCLKTTGTWRGENIHVKRDGSEIFVASAVSILKDERGNRIGFLAVIRDITEHKRMQEALHNTHKALEAAKQKLEERVQEEVEKRERQQHLLIQRSKLESLGKLAAGIAHEINQPLAGISMGLDNIALKLSSGKATEEYLGQKIEALFQHIDRIKRIIEHIRTFSRDQAAIEIERVDVNAVCRNAVSLLHTQYQNHRITLTLDLDDTIGFVLGNGYKLEQVLLNFLTNAKDAVDAKEQATPPSAAYQKQISLITCCDDDRIYLEVRDNGPGICQEDLDNIFDPFFTTKDPAHGTGLGLSVSYGIIKAMHGDIQAQSEPGAYTRMTLVLPRVK